METSNENLAMCHLARLGVKGLARKGSRAKQGVSYSKIVNIFKYL